MGKVQNISGKRMAIDKANAQMVLIVAVAAFISVFSLVATKAVFSRNVYQQKVYSAKAEANDQLEKNLKAWDDLAKSYKNFDTASTNSLGGSHNGVGDNDGSNSKIVLDALPSKYDFPALTSSIEKLFGGRGITVSSITGTDDQISQETNTSSPTPTPVEMPFSFTSTGINYETVNKLFDSLQKSIRPIQVDSLDISGGASNMNVTVNAHTYYQPGKSVNITEKVVK